MACQLCKLDDTCLMLDHQCLSDSLANHTPLSTQMITQEKFNKLLVNAQRALWGSNGHLGDDCYQTLCAAVIAARKAAGGDDWLTQLQTDNVDQYNLLVEVQRFLYANVYLQYLCSPWSFAKVTKSGWVREENAMSGKDREMLKEDGQMMSNDARNELLDFLRENNATYGCHTDAGCADKYGASSGLYQDQYSVLDRRLGYDRGNTSGRADTFRDPDHSDIRHYGPDLDFDVV